MRPRRSARSSGRNVGDRFEGYYKNPRQRPSGRRNGWFWTGDLGYRDVEGFFYFAGRARRLAAGRLRELRDRAGRADPRALSAGRRGRGVSRCPTSAPPTIRSWPRSSSPPATSFDPDRLRPVRRRPARPRARSGCRATCGSRSSPSARRTRSTSAPCDRNVGTPATRSSGDPRAGLRSCRSLRRTSMTSSPGSRRTAVRSTVPDGTPRDLPDVVGGAPSCGACRPSVCAHHDPGAHDGESGTERQAICRDGRRARARLGRADPDR